MVAALLADPSPANSTTDTDTHLISDIGDTKPKYFLLVLTNYEEEGSLCWIVMAVFEEHPIGLLISNRDIRRVFKKNMLSS